MATLKKVLVLTFKDELEKEFRIRLDDPKEGLGQEDVSPVMDAIVTSKVFMGTGKLIAPMSAEVIITQSDRVYQYAG